MNIKKAIVMAMAMTAAACVFARPHGGWGGPRGDWGPRMYHGGWHHHHHHRGYHGLGLAAGIIGLSAVTAGIVRDVVAPPVVYSSPAVYPAGYAAPVVAPPAPVVVAPPAPVVVAPPAPVVYSAPAVYTAPVVYPRVYRRW